MTKEMTKKNDQTAMQAYDYGEMAGAGYENQTQDDVKIPMLNVLQSLSPQVQEGDLRAGQLFNTATEEAMDFLIIVPCTTNHEVVEWVPRDAGGGFVGRHDIDSPVFRNAPKDPTTGRLKNGENDLAETFSIFALVLDDDGEEAVDMVMIPCASTKISAYRGLMTKLRNCKVGPNRVTPPMFAHRVRVSTRLEKRTKGNSFNFVFEPMQGSFIDSLLPPGSPILDAAFKFKEQIAQGEAKADYGSVSDDADSDDIPF